MTLQPKDVSMPPENHLRERREALHCRAGWLRIGFVGRSALLSLVVAGCAYDPPVTGDRQSAAFQADLTACRETAEKNAHHAVISRGPLFMVYPISYPLKKRSEMRKCMVSKGHPLREG